MNLHSADAAFRLFACGLLLAAGCPSARAWNAEGHMVVAQIAYNHLSPVVKARCDALIAVPVFDASTINSNFVTAACWADDIKSYTSAFNTWHYIDLPISLDGTPTNSTVPSPNVVIALNQAVAALQNPTTSLSNQAVQLRFVIHFVGDIEQPLHCSTAYSAAHPSGDNGGNSFQLSGSPNNLHSLWDQGAGYLVDSLSRPLSAGSLTTLNNKVANVEAAYPYTTGFTSLPDPMTWAQEGWNLAGTVAYVGITENTSPSAGYLSTAQATSRQRMAAGGERLADLLNLLLAPKTNVILNLNDSGPNSLRDTVALSRAGDTITFAPGLAGQTIMLTSGAILLSNDVSIDGSTLTSPITLNGHASSRVFLVTNATVRLDSLVLTNGFADIGNGNDVPDNRGGGIYSYGNLVVNRCTFAGNHCSHGGGAINCYAGSLAVSNSTFYGNTAGYGGGAIINYAPATLAQCTLWNNSATLGGAMLLYAKAGVDQCTVVTNAATSTCGGLYAFHGTLGLTNSIVAGDTAPPGSDANVLDNPGAGALILRGAVNYTNDPMLSAPANYGGPTPTLPPLLGSPVIDGCTSGTSFTRDQRGFPRPLGPYADIGAVEGVFNPAGPGQLLATTLRGDGAFQFGFTNYSGMPFAVLASTSAAAPLTLWTNLGLALEAPPGSGQFWFADPQATNSARRFYRVRSP